MKQLLIGAFAFLGLILNLNAQDQTPPADSKAIINFDKTSHDFGKVNEGQIARYEFKFTNTGTEPLTLTKVQASCGCTTPSWPKTPIAVGASGVIVVEFNSAGREGSFTKFVTVESNGGNQTLSITGLVVKLPEQPKSPVIINNN